MTTFQKITVCKINFSRIVKKNFPKFYFFFSDNLSNYLLLKIKKIIINCTINKNVIELAVPGTKEIGGLPIRNEFCPIAGKYFFKYNVNDGTEDTTECNTFSSTLDNCPDGSVFRLQFKKCAFENHGTNLIVENRTTEVDRSKHSTV